MYKTTTIRVQIPADHSWCVALISPGYSEASDTKPVPDHLLLMSSLTIGTARNGVRHPERELRPAGRHQIRTPGMSPKLDVTQQSPSPW